MSGAVPRVLRCVFAHASPQGQVCLDLELPPGATAADAREAARRLLAGDPAGTPVDIPWAAADCGIFGQPCAWTQPLREGDRVELYRPLQADPRESRRNRLRTARRGASATPRGPDGVGDESVAGGRGGD